MKNTLLTYHSKNIIVIHSIANLVCSEKRFLKRVLIQIYEYIVLIFFKCTTATIFSKKSFDHYGTKQFFLAAFIEKLLITG